MRSLARFYCSTLLVTFVLASSSLASNDIERRCGEAMAGDPWAEIAVEAADASHAGHAASRNMLAKETLRFATAMAAQSLHDRNDREDVAQLTAISALRTLPAFRPSEGSLHNWLGTIVVRRTRDFLRHRNVRRQVNGREHAGIVDEVFEDTAGRNADDEEALDDMEERRAAYEEFLAWLRADLASMRSEKRRTSEGQPNYEHRRRNYRVMAAYVTGARSVDIGRRFHLAEQIVANITFRYRTRWFEEGQKRLGWEDDVREAFADVLHGVFASPASQQDRLAGTLMSDRIRQKYLSNDNGLTTADVWDEMLRLPADESLAERYRLNGKTDQEMVEGFGATWSLLLERAEGRLRSSLQTRAFVFRHYLERLPDCTYEDFRAAFALLSRPEQVLLLHRAQDRNGAGLAREMDLVDANAAYNAVKRLDRAVLRMMGEAEERRWRASYVEE